MASLANGTTINGSTAWHAGNDGSGSGLDADTVDGIQGSSLVTKVTSTDNAVVRFDGTTGSVQNSTVVISDTGALSSPSIIAGGTTSTTAGSLTANRNGSEAANQIEIQQDGIAKGYLGANSTYPLVIGNSAGSVIATVDKSGNSTFDGTLTINATNVKTEISAASGNVLKFTDTDGDALTTNIFQSWHQSNGTRLGYFGFGSNTNDIITLRNETGGNINLSTAGGNIELTTPGNINVLVKGDGSTTIKQLLIDELYWSDNQGSDANYFTLQGIAPNIYFNQTDGSNAFVGVNRTSFYVLNDPDGDGTFASKYPLQLSLGSTADGKHYMNGRLVTTQEQITIADDSFAAVDLLSIFGRYGGTLSISANINSGAPSNSAYFLGLSDYGTSPAILSGSNILGTSTTISLAGEPTGTTGADGKMNIYTGGTSGTLYIENRLGASHTFFISLM